MTYVWPDPDSEWNRDNSVTGIFPFLLLLLGIKFSAFLEDGYQIVEKNAELGGGASRHPKHKDVFDLVAVLPLRPCATCQVSLCKSRR